MIRRGIPTENITYLTCARCGQKIMEPFNRNNGPQYYRHRTRQRCDLIAIPIENRTIEIQAGELWEQRLQVEIDNFYERTAQPA